MNASDLVRPLLGLLTLFSSLIVPAWSIYVHRAPELPAPRQSNAELVALTPNATNPLTPVSFDPLGARRGSPVPAPAIRHVTLRRADNLDLFVDKEEFKKLLFPNREEFVRRLGSSWCESQSLVSRLVFRPSVRFRDLSSGETLASYACTNSQTEFHSLD